MIDLGHKTGMRLTAGAKFWAEHLGFGYHQADIRATEYPRENVTGYVHRLQRGKKLYALRIR